MRILYLIQFFGLKNEAGSSRPYTLAKFLADSGHQVTVLCSDVHYLTQARQGPPAGDSLIRHEIHEGIRIIRVRMASDFRRDLRRRLAGYASFAVNALRAGLRLGKQDVVLTSIQPIFVGPIGAMISSAVGGRFVLEVRDVWPDGPLFRGRIRNPLLVGTLRMLERSLYVSAEHLICLTPGIARNLRAKGVPATKLSVAPTGVETGLFEEVRIPREQMRARLGWQDKIVAIHAGAMGESDGLMNIVKAAELLAGRQELQFVFMGEGELKPVLQQWVKERRLSNVTFLPIVPRDVLRDYLLAADLGLIALFNNPYADVCLQNKFFDYLGAGLPIVGALRGDQKNALESIEAGLCVPPDDFSGLAGAILELADDVAKRERMAIRARRAGADRFARDAILAKYSELLVGLWRGGACRNIGPSHWPMFDWSPTSAWPELGRPG